MDESVLISDRQRIEEDRFFARMDDFGFFDTVSEHLPENFTAVFELARVIENMETALGEQLAPVIMMSSGKETPPDSVDYIPNLLPGEEYEADLLRNVQELPAIYPYQFLLPDNVFYQKLVERSLWLPRPRPPQNYRYQSESDIFKPDHRKQKVYLLFDISRSMNMHWRIHLAKAIAFIFLQRNMKELGTVYFRTFAEGVGDLRTATDVPSFNALISEIMHTKALGKGTVLQKALTTAIEDIKSLHTLSDSEILVITDGAAHIELQKLRDMMGSNIRINTVKIGDERIVADAKFVEYHLKDANTDDAKRLKQLHDKRRDIESQLHNAGSNSRRNLLNNEIAMINKQIGVITDRVAKYITDHFGSEIIELSSVYVNVQDISPETFLVLSEEHRSELEELTESLLDALHKEHLREDIQRAAVLFDHLELLLHYNKGEEMNKIKEQKKELEDLFRRIVQTDGDDDEDDIHLTKMDTKQLRNMLEPSVNKNGLSLARLIKLLLKKAKQYVVNQRQIRRARIFAKRKLKRY